VAKISNRLTDKALKALTKPGMHPDGDGLYLAVKSDGGKSWVFRYRFCGKRREMGLGSAADVKLAEARTAAGVQREHLSKGRDPIEARKAKAEVVEVEEAPPAPPVLFGAFATSYIDRKASGWRGRETEKSWRRSFTSYAAALAARPIAEIDTDAVLSVLNPLWTTKAETAAKLRERIEEVLDAATAAGHRSGDNPARWRGHLSHFLPKRIKLQRGHHPALPHEQVAAFFAALGKRQGVSARALEWTLLTAARETMTLEARRGEIDRAAKVWTIPAARMKMATDHRVPISPQADAVLEKIWAPEGNPGDLVFPGARKGRPLSNAAMDMLMREIAPGFVPHGLRSTFRDWAGDETDFPRELAEEALAHAIGDETERAYRRRDALERRRRLMDAWGLYCATPRAAGSPGAPETPPAPKP